MNTIKVNGVETVSVCTGIVHIPLIPSDDHDLPGTDGQHVLDQAWASRSSHDLPEIEGTPVWIWSATTSALLGEHAFEDFRGAKYCHEIRVPVGWSLVSRRHGGTFLCNVFSEEVSALDAIASAQGLLNRPYLFRLVSTTEP